MKNEITLEEVGHIKTLEGLGYDIDEITAAIANGRQFDTYEDIKAQVKELLIKITEAEIAKVTEYCSRGLNNTQITQRIVEQRGNDIYPEVFRDVTQTVAVIKAAEL